MKAIFGKWLHVALHSGLGGERGEGSQHPITGSGRIVQIPTSYSQLLALERRHRSKSKHMMLKATLNNDVHVK